MKYFALSLLIFEVCCSKDVSLNEVDLNIDNLPFEISVYGFISNEEAPCRVVLFKPVSVLNTFKVFPISDAIVVLQHNTDTYALVYDTLGVYTSIDAITAIEGETYKLQIYWQEKTYSAEETMPKSPNDDFFIKFNFEPVKDINGNSIPFDENIGMTTISTHNFGYDQTNLWGFVETDKYTYGKDSLPVTDLFYISNLKVFTHKGFEIQGMFPKVLDFFQLNSDANDSIEVIKAELSSGYNDFIIEMYSETQWQGGMFSTIPGNITTNLTKGGIGYFYALNVKRKRFLVKDLVDLD